MRNQKNNVKQASRLSSVPVRVGQCQFVLKKLTIIVAVFAITMFAKSEEKLNVPPEGFTALFNGEDFTGWTGEHPNKPWVNKDEWKKHWKIENGVIKTYSDYKGYNLGLWTVKNDYKNFHLKFDFFMPDKESGFGANSGILSRVMQFALFAKPPWNVHFACGSKESTEFKKIRRENGITPNTAPHGQWNKAELILIGRKATLTLNGKIVCKDIFIPKEKNDTEVGPIGLKKHANMGKNKEKIMAIEFKNIFIKELD